MNQRRQVALIVETSVVYGREILRGIARFLRTDGRWSVFLDERELNAPPPEWLRDWNGDGVIVRSTTPELAKELQSRNFAVVDLNDRFNDLGLPRVTSDMRELGRMAAEHLVQRGFSRIAYCGFEQEIWCEERLEGVRSIVEPGSVHLSPWNDLRERPWEEEQSAIRDWLLTLPRPVGIVACNDVRAYHVLDACRALQIAVPEEVAVIGIDNAETFCALCDPPLSSVVPNAERVGFEAAVLLHRLMAGEKAPPERLLVPPAGVVTRQSTDSIAIGDPLVAKAARFVRENADRPIGVEDLLVHAGGSRSSLERRFRQTLAISPHEAIRRARIQRVMNLLRETDWSLPRIADHLGFEYPESMMVQFKRETGQTPTQWRLTKNLSDLTGNHIASRPFERPSS